jgi:hypothetical protein
VERVVERPGEADRKAKLGSLRGKGDGSLLGTGSTRARKSRDLSPLFSRFLASFAQISPV